MRGSEVDFDMLKDVINKAKGTSEKECPICDFTGLFRAFGSPPRWDALCLLVVLWSGIDYSL
jgi:hypothetical protein